ncbi:spore coat protein YsxE [Priestia filamentosa]|uniref:spore coat protein YsxE n=1 Tax=Priestia filamentosa TaxID=1402861 RepID=UPI0002F23BFC|nr:spore coat protein YsxE [Priestia filamentosa]
MENSLRAYGPLLQQYGLQADYIEDYGKVKKVFTSKGVFALKRLSSSWRNPHFVQKMTKLHKNGFTKLVPVYPTLEGQYFSKGVSEQFYLTHWFLNERREEQDSLPYKLFRELAELHAFSSYEEKIDVKEKEKHYEELVSRWNERETAMATYVEQSEKEVYMSPFQLYFCTFYYEMTRSLTFAKEQFEKWYEIAKEEGKTRLVINHGKVSTKHFVYDENENGYFINFEEAREGSPVYDLADFYYRSLKTYPLQNLDVYEWFENYESHFPLNETEKRLFCAYLAFPERFYKAFERYQKNSSNEQYHVKMLMESYWHMKNVEALVTKIVEVEKQKEMAELASEQEG